MELLITAVIVNATFLYILFAVFDGVDEQLSIVSKPGGDVTLECYDMPCPLKGNIYKCNILAV